jgi:hypothetical protein
LSMLCLRFVLVGRDAAATEARECAGWS